MSATYVFAYGSLVNPATHGFADTDTARLIGWRRVWRHAAGREVAFLTVERAPGVEVAGTVARVSDAEWPDLHQRERWYVREQTKDVWHGSAGETYVYHAPGDLHPRAAAPLPILLSYIDVVVQGYARAYGEPGVADFFATTNGWDAPVLDDRATPRYGRHQLLTEEERALTDRWLAEMGARLV